MTRISRTELLFLLVVICTYILLCLVVFTFILDDPYITFRYATNWAHGKGIVWNHNEFVEGYSNFTFLALLMPFAFLGFDLYYVSKILSMLFGLGAIILTYLFSKKYFDPKFPGFNLIAPLLLATSAHFTLWAVGGLETTLFALLILLYCYIILDVQGWKRQSLLALVLVLLSLTRPEGPMFVGVTFLFLLFHSRRNKTKSVDLFLWFPLYSAFYGFFLVWRFFYYGDLVPNTYYVKIAGGITRYLAGGNYIIQFLISQGNLMLFLSIIALITIFIRRNRVLFILALSTSAIIGFSVYAGGDWMPGFRFLVPVLPLFYLIIQEAMAGLGLSISGIKSRKLVLVLLFLVLLPTSYINSVKANVAINPLLKGRLFAGISEKKDWPQYQVADFLFKNAGAGDLIAIQETGIIPFQTMHLNYIDILGLNDRHIALEAKKVLHWDKGDADYVLKRHPDWLALWVLVRANGELRAAMPAVAAIMNHPTVTRDYELVDKFPTPEPGKAWSTNMVFFIYKKRIRG